MAKPHLPGRTYKINKCCDCGQGMNQVGNRKRCAPCAYDYTTKNRSLRSKVNKAAHTLREASTNE